MQDVFFPVIISVILVSLISLVGIISLYLSQKVLKHGLVYLVALAGGALWGDALIHLLPEAVENMGFTLEISLAVLGGVITMLIVEKIVHWRHCHMSPHHADHVHPFAWMNLVGDAVHNFLDGIIIAAAYLVSIPVGISTTIAVVFHEIPQEIGDFGVLVHGGFSVWRALKVNLISALFSVVGALLVLFWFPISAISWLVPFAAGNFLYIAGADLIPELHKEVNWKKSVGQLVFFLIGILVMVALLGLE